jgi:hypothetical protein
VSYRAVNRIGSPEALVVAPLLMVTMRVQAGSLTSIDWPLSAIQAVGIHAALGAKPMGRLFQLK